MTQSIRNGPDPLSLNSPVLHGLTEVEFIKDLLSTQDFEGVPRQEIQGFEAKILKKHLRKTIIDYALQFGNSPNKHYIGLHRESDERLGLTFSVLKELTANGFGENSTLAVPRPILYMPSLSFLLMEKAVGRPLREVLQGEEEPEPYVRSAARWLAKLHSSSARLPGQYTRQDDIAASERFANAALWLFPRYKSKIQSVSRQLIDAVRALQPVESSPIHGDYHPKNIIVSPQCTSVIDFEEAGMGDPAFDLGYFVAQTKMTHGIRPSITRATEAFLQEYQENQPANGRDFARRVAVFEAQTYFQRIYHTYYLLALKPNLDMVSEWLNESETCLRKAESRA